mmetsp:Transcript_91586/g.191455  ORF Transcript_91586/g.191455 Transcript_91586/m.191455 type:complete len:241 (-) Transcript_91586:165-887(-)
MCIGDENRILCAVSRNGLVGIASKRNGKPRAGVLLFGFNWDVGTEVVKDLLRATNSNHRVLELWVKVVDLGLCRQSSQISRNFFGIPANFFRIFVQNDFNGLRQRLLRLLCLPRGGDVPLHDLRCASLLLHPGQQNVQQLSGVWNLLLESCVDFLFGQLELSFDARTRVVLRRCLLLRFSLQFAFVSLHILQKAWCGRFGGGELLEEWKLVPEYGDEPGALVVQKGRITFLCCKCFLQAA